MIDLMSPEVRRNPYPLYAQVRAMMPVIRDPRTGLWMMFGYEAVKRALSDPETFSSDPMTGGYPRPEWLIFFDPPRHSKLRDMILRSFTPATVAALEPRIRELSRTLLDAALAKPEFDLVEDYAAPLPMQVISSMLGIPLSEWQRFRRWSEAILRLSYTAFDAARQAEAAKEYFAVTEKMSGALPAWLGSGGLLTQLHRSELSPQEILSFFQLLLVAGNETTTNLIANAVICLSEHPAAQQQLRGEPALLPRAIEEVLRFRSPLQFVYRVPTRDFNGIPKGALVLPVVGSANRDPAQFTDPDRFDITRDPNPHVAFGHGIHFCLGAALSRIEARVALSDLMERIPHFECSPDWEPREALNVMGPKELKLIGYPRGAATVADL